MNFCCPITKLIFCCPVLAEDGFIYEELAIIDWFKHNSTSFTNQKQIDKKITPVETMKNIVNDYLEKNPQYKTEQFLFKKPFSLFKQEFFGILENKKYDMIKDYTSFLLNYYIGKETIFEHLCKNCDDDVIKHVIDNSLDLDLYEYNKKFKPVHVAIKNTNSNLLKYLIDKGIDLDAEDAYGDRVINYLLNYHINNIDLICYVLDKGIDINFQNKEEMRPIIYIILRGNIELLKKCTSQYNLNLDLCPKGINDFLLCTFKYCNNKEFIKHVINMDLKMNDQITYEIYIYKNKTLSTKDKQEIAYYYLYKTINKMNIIENFN
jgi:hypothetical protein